MSITAADTGISTVSSVMCRNMMDGATHIASDPRQTHSVIFAGSGDPNGEDVQPIPEELLRTPQFVRELRQGVLSVVQGEDNPIVQAALQKQSDSFRARMKADELKAREVLDAPAQDDMIAVQCIGPGTRPDTTCEDQIPVRARDKDSQPPLCSRHRDLVDRCVRRGSGPWVLEPEERG